MTKRILFGFFLAMICNSSFAHRSGCHRWHSCPSDSGSYTCGDIGYCSGCPNNQYCKNGKPKSLVTDREPVSFNKDIKPDAETFLDTSGLVPLSPTEQCHQYLKYGIPSQHGTMLCRKGYVLNHNAERKTPDWVIEYLTREKVQAVLERSDNFQPDPDLPSGMRADLIDYKDSGYDRGHMAPAANMRWDNQAMNESFFLSNMAPQVGVGMNRGIWKDLEEKVRTWTTSRYELFIFTGPIYNGSPATIGINKVAVPASFYKIVFDPIHIEAIAFKMPNTKLKTQDMPNYIVSIDVIEHETGLDFLSNLNDEIEYLLEANKEVRVWK